jgi:intracellular multiplication protein IcmJ
MRLLPLVPTAHPSAWPAGGGSGARREADLLLQTPCRFCGLIAAGWQEPFHLNGDHTDDSAANVVAGCALCHLVQHLDRPAIEDEAVLIWLPEMSQAALNAVVRRTQLVFHVHGEPPSMDRRPSIGTSALRTAFRTYQELSRRSEAALARLGSASPRDLGAALLSLPKAAQERRRELLGGLRLLGRGRLFRGGRDVYPQLLDALRAPPPAA